MEKEVKELVEDAKRFMKRMRKLMNRFIEGEKI